MPRAKHPRLAPLMLLAMALAGCGYHFSGRAGAIPGYLRRIAVPMFSNATAVPGLEHRVTAAVRTELQRDGRVRLGAEASSTALLRGAIRRHELQLLATNRADFALEYRVELEVHIVVEDLQRRQTILDQTLAVNSDYVVSPQIVPTEIARERALQAMARDAGARVVGLLLDGF